MSAEESMRVFTAARMRPGFGEGVSIPSQRRWLGYVESWAREHERRYVDQRVRIHSVQIFGLRAGVRVAIRGFVEEGRRIQTVHVFRKGERRVVGTREDDDDEAVDVVLTPEKELWTPTSDVDVEFERRSSTTKYVVTSIAHVWFNAFFEGKGEQRSGVFEIEWAKLDGIKGTSRKGVQALEKLQVVWSVENEGKLVEEPAEGGEVQALGRAEGGSVGGESSRVEVEGEDIITDGDFVSEESGVESRESGEGQTGKKPVDNGDEAGKNLGESGKETGKNLGENGEGAGEKLKDGEETGKSLEDGEETRKKLEDGEETGKRPEETDKTPKKFGKKSKSNPKKTMEDLEETGPAEDGGKKFAENVTGKYGAKKLEEDREEDASNLEEAGPARNEGKKVEDVTMPVEGRNGTI